NTSLTIAPTYDATAGAGDITDASANEMANAETVAGTDGARPVIMSTSPLSGGTISRDANITMVLSEEPASCTATLASGLAVVCSISTTTVTLNPSGSLNSGTNTITLATAPDTATNVLNGAISGVTHPVVFTATGTSTSSSDDTTAVETSVDPAITITAPAAGAELEPMTQSSITWSSEGDITKINIDYSIDGGSTWVNIVTNASNNGSYSWLVPDIDADDVTIKVTGTDLITELASDESETFSIGSSDDASTDTDDDVTAPSTGETGLSPVTGEVEDISEVNVGDYIRSTYFSTIYYIDTGMVRRPFMDSQTFMTYEDDFSDVIMVTDATLPTMSLGAPMLPKAGIVLVKIQSDARVYFVEENADGEYELRWVISEDVASDMFGSRWADYVIDVNVTLFPHYENGDDIEEAISVGSDIKTRAEVNS
ncbi:MAG: hypothetical protein NUV56_03695, partial [Candidatus Uhrbacteria bacterium]|nr:hypothetical protein [Candidatus Uhrbacteria bacterium]